MSTTLHIEPYCVYCFESTEPGSGKFVDRITADRRSDDAFEDLTELGSADAIAELSIHDFSQYDFVFGYACADCMECDEPDTCFHDECMDARKDAAEDEAEAEEGE